MNKPINNHVQAGQLNHVQACQQAKTSLVDRLVDKYSLSTVFFLFIGTSDPCNPNPCQNSGTCSSDSDTPTGFMCHCPAGWNGTTCQGTVLIPGRNVDTIFLDNEPMMFHFRFIWCARPITTTNHDTVWYSIIFWST